MFCGNLHTPREVTIKSGALLSPADFERMADEIDDIANAMEKQREELSFAERLRQFARQLRLDAKAAALNSNNVSAKPRHPKPSPGAGTFAEDNSLSRRFRDS